MGWSVAPLDHLSCRWFTPHVIEEAQLITVQDEKRRVNF
jgi:hypothetical protein